MPLAGSYTNTKDPVYKESEEKFKKRALVGDYRDREPGSEIGRYKKGYDERMSKENKMKKVKSSKKDKDEFYKDALGSDYESDDNKDTNVKKVSRVGLKDFLRMHDKFSYEKPNK